MVLLSILVFFVLFSLLILIHEAGHFYAARFSGVKVEEFGLGLGKKLYGKKVGETEYTFNAVPFGGFVRLLGEEQESRDPRSFSRASLPKRIAITLAGVCMNYLFSLVLLTILFTVGTKPILISEADVAQAEALGMIEFSQPDEEGKREVLHVQEIQKDFPASFVFALTETKRITWAIVDKVADIPLEIIEKKRIPDEISGPVGIAEVTHKIVPLGIFALMKLAALLSLSLAVMNLLPIPALDGGRFLFQLVELLLSPFQVRMSERLENAIHLGGYGLLMIFLLAVTWNDIMRLLA